MSEYDRYAATCDLRGMEKDELGYYVKHSDYKQMRVRAEKAESEVERLNSLCNTYIEIYKNRTNEYLNTCTEFGDYKLKSNLEIKRLREENEQLKQALRECDPYNDDSRCKFCGFAADYFVAQHSDNCEYIQLTKYSNQ